MMHFDFHWTVKTWATVLAVRCQAPDASTESTAFNALNDGENDIKISELHLIRLEFI